MSGDDAADARRLYALLLAVRVGLDIIADGLPATTPPAVQDECRGMRDALTSVLAHYADLAPEHVSDDDA
jgi:hypothetical protein